MPNSTLTPADLAELRVLVVDDHIHTARLIGDVLRAGGVGEVYTAPDGHRARDLLQSRHPDIIFTDLHMPSMDGLELTRSIRRAAVEPDPKVPNPQVPIVMVTIQCSERDVRIARMAGVNEFVIKPFTPAALLSRIQLVLSKPRPFIISESYVGPDRRRRVELNYSGPLRRNSDPAEVIDADERDATRETIGVELEAMRRLIAARGGLDRSLAQMTFRVMQHTHFRARQVRDAALEKATDALIGYVEAMGGPDAADPRIIEAHFNAVRDMVGVNPPAARDPVQFRRELDAAAERASAAPPRDSLAS
jgi:CheY-like chemotaxis protein